MNFSPSRFNKLNLIEAGTSMDSNTDQTGEKLENQRQRVNLNIEHGLMEEIIQQNNNYQRNQLISIDVNHIDLTWKKRETSMINILSTYPNTEFSSVKTMSLSLPLSIDNNDFSCSEDATSHIELKEVENLIKLAKS